MFRYTNYQKQAKELARVSVELIYELNEEGIDTGYMEILCRRLHQYGYINMDGDNYVLDFISNGRRNAKERKE